MRGPGACSSLRCARGCGGAACRPSGRRQRFPRYPTAASSGMSASPRPTGRWARRSPSRPTACPPNAEVQIVWRTVKGSWKVANAEYHGRDFTARRLSDRQGEDRRRRHRRERISLRRTISASAMTSSSSRATTALSQTGFYIDMSVDVSPKSGPVGTPITVDVKGIGWRSLHNSWQLLYDNSYTGWISSVTTGGSAHFTIPATGAAGPHVLEVIHGGFTFPYRNMQQSPEPDRPQFAIPVHHHRWRRGAAAAARRRRRRPTIRNLPAPGDLRSRRPSRRSASRSRSAATGFTPGKTYTLNWTTVTGNRVSGGGWEEVLPRRRQGDGGRQRASSTSRSIRPTTSAARIHSGWRTARAKKTGTLWIQPTALPLERRPRPGRHALHHPPQGRRLDRDRQHLHDRLRQLLCRLCLRLQQPGRRGDPSVCHRPARLALHRPLPGDLQGQGEGGPNNFRLPQLTYAADHPGEDLPHFRFAFKVTAPTVTETRPALSRAGRLL